MITQEDYYSLEGYANYSLLKKVATSGNLAFLEPEEKEISWKLQNTFDIGKILERYFLEDRDLSYIRIDNTKNLTATTDILFKSLLAYLKEQGVSSTKELEDSDIINFIKEQGLWDNIKNKDILLERAAPAIEKVNFYLSLKEGDVLAVPEIFDIIKKADDALLDYPEVRKYLYPEEGIEVLTQFPIVIDFDFDSSGLLPSKGLLDRVLIDHKNSVISIVDFKTTESRVEEFMRNFYMHKYYYQIPFYMMLFGEYLAKERPDVLEYAMEGLFVVISKSMPEIPAVYKINAQWFEKAFVGWINKAGYRIKGISELMHEINWYKNIGGTRLSYDLAINDNVIIVEEDWYE